MQFFQTSKINLVMMQLTWSWLTGETFSICCNSYQSNKAIKYQYVQNFLNRKNKHKNVLGSKKVLNYICGFHFWTFDIDIVNSYIVFQVKNEGRKTFQKVMLFGIFFMCLQIFSNFTFYILSKANMGIRFRFQ